MKKWFWIGVLCAEIVVLHVHQCILSKRIADLEFVADIVFWGCK